MEAMQNKARSGCHVATSPRRDVTKPRRRVNNVEVNNLATSRRHHVATSSRKSASQHLMYGRLKNEGIGKRTRRSTEFQSQRIQTSKECPGFIPLSILLDIIEDMMMMFLRLDTLFFSFMMV